MKKIYCFYIIIMVCLIYMHKNLLYSMIILLNSEEYKIDKK